MADVKIDETSFSTEKTETKIAVATYDIAFLVAQKETILKQKAAEMAQRDAELAEIEALITKALGLGIKLPAIETAPAAKADFITSLESVTEEPAGADVVPTKNVSVVRNLLGRLGF